MLTIEDMYQPFSVDPVVFDIAVVFGDIFVVALCLFISIFWLNFVCQIMAIIITISNSSHPFLCEDKTDNVMFVAPLQQFRCVPVDILSYWFFCIILPQGDFLCPYKNIKISKISKMHSQNVFIRCWKLLFFSCLKKYNKIKRSWIPCRSLPLIQEAIIHFSDIREAQS